MFILLFSGYGPIMEKSYPTSACRASSVSKTDHNGIILAHLAYRDRDCPFWQLQSIIWFHTCAVETIPAWLVGWHVHMSNFQPC